MSLCCNLNGIADFFRQTSQIISVELLWFFFVNNLFAVPGIAEIRASMVYFEQIDAIGCRNEDFFALTLFPCYDFQQKFSCLFISWREKKQLDFWTENDFYGELFEACFSLQCRRRRSVNSISDISAKMQHFFYYLLNLFQQRGSLCFTMHSLRVEIKFPDFKNLENRDNYLETFYQLMEHWTSQKYSNHNNKKNRIGLSEKRLYNSPRPFEFITI